MANTCYYEIRAKGEKQGIEALLSHLNKCGTKESQFYRVWDFILNDEGIEDMCHDVYQLEGCGDCAWSVTSTFMTCMIHQPEPFIIYLSRHYGLLIEFISEECGLAFSEHIIIDKGNIRVNDCADVYYKEYEDGSEDVFGTFELTI
jgi:hypothetical protein